MRTSKPAMPGRTSVGRLGALLAILALLMPHTAAAQMTIDAVAQQIRNQNVTGATITTHGFQLTDTTAGGDALMPLGQAVRTRITAANQNAWLRNYDVGADGRGRFNANSILPNGNNNAGHVVVMYDWAPGGNEDAKGWAEAAGNNLFGLVTELGLASPAPRTGRGQNLHFIAHSFGAPVTSEAVERLAAHNVPVDQVTYLDPHDFDQPSLAGDTDPMHFTLGRPAGYGASVWKNTAFADVYYQTRGEHGSVVSDKFSPRGRPIPGAFNDLMDTELPARGQYNATDGSGDHSYVWDTFYRGTVLGAQPANTTAPMNAPDWDSRGYALSGVGRALAGNQAVARPAAGALDFFDNQDHTFQTFDLIGRATSRATTDLVTLTIENNNEVVNPNQAAITATGKTQAQLEQVKWEPAVGVHDIFNGDCQSAFRRGRDAITTFDLTVINGNVDLVSGWSNHGGGGEGDVLTDGDERFLFLGAAAVDATIDDISDGIIDRTYNRLYVPQTARKLSFDLQRTAVSGDDQLRILLGDDQLAALALNAADGQFMNKMINIPKNLRDQVDTLALQLVVGANGTAEAGLRLDNLRFIPEPATVSLLVAGFLPAIRRRRRRD